MATLTPVDHDPFAEDAREAAAVNLGRRAKPFRSDLSRVVEGLPDYVRHKLGELVTLPQRAIEASRRDLATGGNEAVGPALEAAGLVMGGTGFGAPKGALGAGPVKPAPAQGIRAYHGSPHDFDKFDLSKIGTGEGAQSYGHGLYFAENPNVAADYRRSLAKSNIDPFTPLPPDVKEAALAISGQPYSGPFLDKARSALRQTGDWRSAFDISSPELQRHAAAVDRYFETVGRPPGVTYEVNINAKPEQFLDWDAPLSKQPEAIREIYKGIYPDDMLGRDLYHAVQNDRRDIAIIKGQNAQTTLPATQHAASAEFREAGIPGIRYLDQGSRFTPREQESLRGEIAKYEQMLSESPKTIGYHGVHPDVINRQLTEAKAKLAAMNEPTRNYVVFDDNIVQILRKYGLAGMSMLPPATAAFLADKIGPVDHDPFARNLTPVDHDPWM